MWIIFIVALFSTSTVVKADGQNCNGTIVQNITYVKELLKDGIGSPYQLAIYYATNMLFFSYSTNDSYTELKSAYIDMNSNKFGIIEGIKNAFANAVDQETNTIYLGGSDGIYKFDLKSKTAKHINGTSHSVWQMFYKKNLYYSTYPDEHVYVYKNGDSQRLPELMATKGMLVAIDNNENIYFSNSSGLHVYKKIQGDILYLDDYILNGITSDINGNLFFSTPNGIFFIDSKNDKIENLITMTMNDIYGVAVESDGNLIYSSENSIVRLKPIENKCIH